MLRLFVSGRIYHLTVVVAVAMERHRVRGVVLLARTPDYRDGFKTNRNGTEKGRSSVMVVGDQKRPSLLSVSLRGLVAPSTFGSWLGALL